MDTKEKELAMEDLNICRLCFRSGLGEKFTQLEPFEDIIRILTSKSISKNVNRDEATSMLLCRECVDQLNAAIQLQKRINFTEAVWTRISSYGLSSRSITSIDECLLWHCHVCNDHFNYPDLLSHIKSVHDQESHACKFCETLLNMNAQEYNSNENNPSDNERVFCTICPKSYTRRQKLREHLKKHHNMILESVDEIFSCNQCGQQFKSANRYDKHVLSHGGRLFKCTPCHETFTNLTEFQNHKQNCSQQNEETSEVDETTFNDEETEEDLTTENTSNITETPKEFACKLCPRSFTRKSKLEEHLIKQHNPISKNKDHRRECTVYTCGHCGELYKSMSLYDQHLKTHDSKPFKCSVCNTGFPSRSEHRMHEFSCLPENEEETVEETTISIENKTDDFFRTTEEVNQILEEQHLFACKLCPKTYTRREKLREHLKKLHDLVITIKSHKPEGNFFTCDYCGERFRNIKCFDKHVRSHDSKPFKCSACNEGFSNRLEHRDHEFNCLQENPGSSTEIIQMKEDNEMVDGQQEMPIEATVIKETESDFKLEVTESPDTDMEYEIEDSDEGTAPQMDIDLAPFWCYICSVSYTRREKLLQHLQAIHNITISKSDFGTNSRISEFVCECGKIYNSSQGYIKHIRTHDDTPYRCSICNEGFEYSKGRVDHETVCSQLFAIAGDGTIPCVVCRKSFKTIDEVKFHKEDEHSKKAKKSEKSTEAFAANKADPDEIIHDNVEDDISDFIIEDTTLEDHSVENEIPKNTPSAFIFPCSQCDKMYRSQAGYDAHILTHNPMPFRCTACRMAFKTRSERVNHERSECLRLFKVARDVYQCLSCNELFPDVVELQGHRNAMHPSAAEGLPHDCHICMRMFKYPQELLAHLESHKGKNFKCGKCELKYSNIKLLKFHYRVHDEKTSLMCPICGQMLSRSDKLTEHMYTHNGFPCTRCNAVLASRTEWQQHRKMHTNEKLAMKRCKLSSE